MVIGNPPYVDIKALPKDLVKAIFREYETAENRINLYSVFIERGYQITKSGGFLSFINPNSILVNSSYLKIRKLLIDEVTRIVKLPDNVFNDASVETIIFEFRKSTVTEVLNVIVYSKGEIINTVDNNLLRIIEKNAWKKSDSYNYDIYSTNKELKLLDKIKTNSVELSECAEFSLGITPYDKYKGHTEDVIKNRAFHAKNKINDNYKPLITGENVIRFFVNDKVSEFINYGAWLGASRDPRFFTSPRIIIRQIVSGNPPRIYAGYTEADLYFTQIGFGVISKFLSPKYLLCLINSKLLNFFHKYSFLDLEKELFQKILIANCKRLPIKIIDNHEQLKFINSAQVMIDLIRILRENSDRFENYIVNQIKVDSINSRLRVAAYDLTFPDFIKELNKAIKASKGTPLTKKDEFEWMELFEDNKKKVLELKAQIDQTDREIDRMVYALYDLTEDEIRIVEQG